MTKKIKLNLACGTRKYESNKEWEVINIDYNQIVEPDIVRDLKYGLPFNNEYVDEILCEHYIEHLNPEEFVRFFNECWRVLKPGGTLQVSAPYYKHRNAYVDPTHIRLLTEFSFDFFCIRDFNSLSAGVTGWYDIVSITVPEDFGQVTAIMTKNDKKHLWTNQEE